MRRCVDPPGTARVGCPRLGAPTLSIEARGLTDVGQRRDHNEDALLVDDAPRPVHRRGRHGRPRRRRDRLAARGRDHPRRRRAREGGRARAVRRPPGRTTRASPTCCGRRSRRPARSSTGRRRASRSSPGWGRRSPPRCSTAPTAFVAHVGDSRCYLLREGRIYQVSEDHSLVNEQLKAGAISLEEAKHSRFKNIITRSVGFEQQVVVDLIGLELEAGDALVVCCDGLSNLVDDPEILSIVEESPIELAPGRLVALANDRGGDDNITVIVIRATAG